MVSDHEKRRRQAIITRAKRILNDPDFTARQMDARAATKRARRVLAESDARQARERREVEAGVERLEREVGQLELLTRSLLRADAARRAEMIDGIVRDNLSSWPSLQPNWKKR